VRIEEIGFVPQKEFFLPKLFDFGSFGRELVISTSFGEVPEKSILSSSTRTATIPPRKKDTTEPSAMGFPDGVNAKLVLVSSGATVDCKAESVNDLKEIMDAASLLAPTDFA
jgi:hypothetical protein